MKNFFRILLGLLALLPALSADEKPAHSAAEKYCGCACCQGKEVCCCHPEKPDATPPAGTGQRHPLKGVVVEVYADKGSALVKHGEIPGFMAAMTMLFKVDAATLKSLHKGQAITGTLVRRGEDFWLEDVKPTNR